jgi:hypothetical protein
MYRKCPFTVSLCNHCCPGNTIVGSNFYSCMYVRMYVHMYVRMYVCTYVCMYVCMYVCTYVCTYVHMYVRMYVCTYVGTHVCMYVCMCMYVCTNMYVYLYVCMYMYVSMYVCMHVCVLCVYVDIYVCICMYVHTYMRTYVCNIVNSVLQQMVHVITTGFQRQRVNKNCWHFKHNLWLQSGLISALPYLSTWISSIMCGFLSQWLQAQDHISQLSAYRIFNGVGKLCSANSMSSISSYKYTYYVHMHVCVYVGM